MAGIKFLLGLIPETAKVEAADDQLRSDFQKFKKFENSDELKRFLELEKEVTSIDFAQRKKKILSKKFKDTEEYQKLKEYKSLEKSKPIKNYFKVKDSKKLEIYQDVKKSDVLKRYHELEMFIKSDAYSKAKAQKSPKEFKNSEEGRKEKEFFTLRKSPQIKKHFKFENSPAYREFKRIENSEKLKEYKNLKEFVNSSKFKEVRDYMSLSPKKRYELSDEHKKETEYEELKDSERFKWYFKMKKKYPFKEIEKWDLAFEDKFEGGALNSKYWMNRYFYGDKLLDKSYVLADDKHSFTDGKNIEFSGDILRIITRKEQSKGLSWNPVTGFTEKEFDYTSDLISTAKSANFMQGLFKAKVKIGKSDVTQAFSLQAMQILPHIDVFRYENNKLKAGNFWKNNGKNGIGKSLETTRGSRFSNDFFIYSLEWQPGKLIWKINGITFKEQTRGVPDEGLYLVFNASLKETAKEAGLPSAMAIDWVRVYKAKE